MRSFRDGVIAAGAVTVDPLVRLARWLNKRNSPIEQFNLRPIDLAKLREILGKMNKNHSCGIDMIDGFSINLAAPHIEKVLLHLVNISILQSDYPKYWKVSRISPYFKNKGDRTDGEMYRPVSNLIYVGMICEKVVAEQMLNHFVDNNLWHPNHHGFRPNHSTATALIQLYDMWITGVENGEFTAALLLDLSAAFDLMDHQILLGKLKLYNFSEDTIAWFTSYLHDRVCPE